jgi:hypothetical protein
MYWQRIMEVKTLGNAMTKKGTSVLLGLSIKRLSASGLGSFGSINYPIILVHP